MDFDFPIRLDGTKTSDSWANKPAYWDYLNLKAIYPSTSRYGYPTINTTDTIPTSLRAYSAPGLGPQEGCAYHTFLHDYRFEKLWYRPDITLPRLFELGIVLSPDFSVWADMPRAMQQWQIYRNRWLAAWWTQAGLTVIPTVTWGAPDSYDFVFDSIEPGGTVALATVGNARGKRTQEAFMDGYREMLRQVQPATVLVYGKIFDSMRELDVPLKHFSARGFDGR